MKENIILMADIVGSRQMEQTQLLMDFKELVAMINSKDKAQFLSPLTITLGDEFQGVLTDLKAAIKVIIDLEEALISQNKAFKLRYVIAEGLIETPINKEIAYGMMGDGLTRARGYLEHLKKDGDRFFIWLIDQPQKNALNNLFIALQNIIDDWNVERDFYLVTAFLQFRDYKRVAMELQKERSLMWKREKTLKIKSYFALKEVADYLTHA